MKYIQPVRYFSYEFWDFFFLIASKLGVLNSAAKTFSVGSEACVLVTLKGFKQSFQTFVAWGFCSSNGILESHGRCF